MASDHKFAPPFLTRNGSSFAASTSSSSTPPSGPPGPTISAPTTAETVLELPQVEATLLSPSSPIFNVPPTIVQRHDQVPGALETSGRQASGSDYFSQMSHLSSPVPDTDAPKKSPIPPHIAQNPERFIEAAREELYGNPAKMETFDTSPRQSSAYRTHNEYAASEHRSEHASGDYVRSMPVRSKTEHPQFPNQSLAALHTQVHHPRAPAKHYAHSRYASSSQSNLISPTSTFPSRQMWQRPSHATRASRTADNTAVQTPGLFASRPTHFPIHPFNLEGRLDESSEASSMQASPYLHPAQQQPPRTVTSADRQVDTFSGRKMINHYEIVAELGRGVHGKVKFARDLDSGKDVAIKIISRSSKRTRLGKSAISEDKVKKEVAILKKIQHPNVVRLIEVIDDPDIAKVYLVLEFCELKEIYWRHSGYAEVILAEHHRQQAEMKGLSREDQDATWRKIDAERRLKRRIEARRKPQGHGNVAGNDEQGLNYWSLEYGGDTDDESYATSEPASQDMVDRRMSEEDSTLDKSSSQPSDLDLRKHITTGSSGTSETRPHSSSLTPSHNSAGDSSTSWNRTSTSANFHQTRDSQASIDYFETPAQTEGFSFYSTEWYQDEGRYLSGPTFDQIREANVRQSSLTGSSTTFTDMYENEVPEESRYVPTMSIHECRSAFRDVLVGIEYLHYQGIVHRDIKPENLLRNRDRRVKISDFGVSYLGRPIRNGEDSGEVSETEGEDFDEETALAKNVGTPAFYAPELCNLDMDSDAPVVTGQIDIWALGVTLFCILFARTPFTAENQFALMRKISEEEVFIPRLRLKAVNPLLRSPGPHGALYAPDKRLPDQWKHEPIDDELYDLLKRVLEKNPKDRITIQELKHHPWVLKGLGNPVAWLEETKPANFGFGEKIEISNEEVAEAVIPIKIVQRIRSFTKRATSAFGLGSRRKRGQSSATSETGSAAQRKNSSKERRRQSLQPNEPTSSASKVPGEKESFEHPLATSVTASPNSERERQLPDGSQSSQDSPNMPSQGVSAIDHSSMRPAMPDRQVSEISTSASIRTIRQSDYPRGRPSSFSPPPSSGPSSRSKTFLEAPVPSSLTAIFGNAGRSLLRTLSRDTTGHGSLSHGSSSGSREAASVQVEPTENGANTTSGHVDIARHLNNRLGDGDEGSPNVSESYYSHDSGVSADAAHSSSPGTTRRATPSPLDEHGQQHRSSVDFGGGASRGAAIFKPSNREPTDEEYHRAMDNLNRRRILEDTQDQEHENASRLQSTSQDACPPSPDDQSPERTRSIEQQLQYDLDLNFSPSSTAFSSEDHVISDQSRSASHPSIPSIVSGDFSEFSEPVTDRFLKLTDSSSSSEVTAQTYTSTPLSPIARQVLPAPESDDGYVGDGDGNGEDMSTLDDEEDDSSDSDEDFLVLHRQRSKVSNRRTRTGSSRRSSVKHSDVKTNIKSTRSGSTNTMRQVSPDGSAVTNDGNEN